MNTKNDRNRQKLINEQFLTVRKVGEGGFGVVWKAYDFSLRNFVALKELLEEYNEQKFIEMFYKEALIAKNLIHDNIVRVQHFWKGNNERYYIMMDYVSGDSLENIISRAQFSNKELPWEISVHIVGNVLKAIDYANKTAKDPITGKLLGLVYRDISPGNVLVSFDGGVKISDFGIAKTAEDINCGTKRKILAGKFGYMSPEQLRCDDQIDHRSDIFSVGVILYELLSGKRLFKGSNEEIKSQVLNHKFNIKELKKEHDFPEGLAEIIEKSVQRNREDRYDRAIEMFRDMRRLLKSRESEDLELELSGFLAGLMPEKYDSEKESIDIVKEVNIQQIKSDGSVEKISCKDFIMGSSSEKAEMKQGEAAEPRQAENDDDEVAIPKQNVEEKGKTVFEEVGDWFINKYRNYKRKVLQAVAVFLVAAVLFSGIDIFLKITPFGKSINSMLYPPDITVTTIPAGAKVTIKTRDGKIIVSGADSSVPIALSKIPPKTYIVTAEKENFNPVERLVKIEEQFAKGKKKVQKIELLFDFELTVNSDVEGAEIFVDGSKVGVTKWSGVIMSGEHTVKLSAPGFEDLGSVAKEFKEGQCNIDFTKGSVSEIFGGIDTRNWQYTMLYEKGKTQFILNGTMVKKVTVNSIPQKMLLHIKGEPRARGRTPITVALKSGEYVFRLMDQEGKFAEANKPFIVNKESPNEIKIPLNKWITVKIKAKGMFGVPIKTMLNVSGNKIEIDRRITNTDPVRIAIPLGIYKFSFSGDELIEPLVLKGIDIVSRNTLLGEIVLRKVPLKVTVKDEDNETIIPFARIWRKDKLLGETDQSGSWQDLIEHGTSTLGIVADGYLGKTVEYEIRIDRPNELEIKLVSEDKVPVSLSAEPAGIGEIKSQLEDVTSTVGTAVGKSVGISSGKNVSESLGKSMFDAVAKSTETVSIEQTLNIAVCDNCGVVYRYLPGKKPRFCTNCGKTIK